MRDIAILAAAAAATILPISPLAAAQDDPQPSVAELRTVIEQIRTEMLRPGERVTGWNRGGADPDSDVRAQGADGHYMLTRDSDGDSISILTSRSIADLAPEGWRVVDSFGDPATALDHPQVDFEPISPRYVFAARTQFSRRGDVDCTGGITNARLYEIPGAPAGENDEIIPFMFRVMILALEGQEMCVRSDGNAERGYTARIFLPDGRLLPEMSRDPGTTTIVPAAPVERLVQWRGTAPARRD